MQDVIAEKKNPVKIWSPKKNIGSILRNPCPYNLWKVAKRRSNVLKFRNRETYRTGATYLYIMMHAMGKVQWIFCHLEGMEQGKKIVLVFISEYQVLI